MAISGAISGRQSVVVARPVTRTAAPSVPKPQTTDRRKFFEGGLVGKAFDVLQLPEFAFAGLGTGAQKERERQRKLRQARGQPTTGTASFKEAGQRLLSGLREIPTAIRERRQISSQPGDFSAAEEASKLFPGIGRNKFTKGAFNLATSLAIPAPPIGKGFGLAKKVPGLGKVIQGAQDVATAGVKAARQSERVGKAVESVVPFFRNPEVGARLQKAEAKTTQRVSSLFRTIKSAAQGLSGDEQKEVGRLIEAGRDARQAILATGENRLVSIADDISKIADDVGREAVEAGLLDPTSFENYKGRYMTHIWADAVNGTSEAIQDIPKVSGKFFQQRKGAEGFVEEFAPATFKGLGTEIKDIEAAKFYKGIADDFGVKLDTASPEDLLKAAEGNYKSAEDIAQLRRTKSLKGTLVPPEVHDYLKATLPKQKGLATQVFDSVYNSWKAGKTIWNPAYHVRNIISNQILSQMSTGKNIVNTIIDTVQSASNYFKKGGEPFVNTAQDIGLIKKVDVGTAFNELLDSAFQLERVKGNWIQQVAPRAGEFVRNLQNTTEEVSKLAVFRSWVESLADDAVVGIEKALQDENIVARAAEEAEKAIFSPYRIAQKERELVSRIVPFYSFTRQVVPFTAETFVKRPQTLAKFPKLKTNIEGLSDQVIPGSERRDYQQDQIQLPIKVNGESVAFDPTFIYPFGSIGEFNIARGQLPGGLSVNPLISEPVEQIFNRDLFFDRDIATSQIPGVGTDVLSTKPRRSGSQRLAKVLRTVSPAAFTTVQGKLLPAFRGETDYVGRTRNKVMSVLDAAGFKLTTLRPEDNKKFDRLDQKEKISLIRKQMRTIQRDQSLASDEKRFWVNELREELRRVSSER